MIHSQHIASVLAAVALTSCCQTLWLKVTRREGAPSYAAMLPEIQPGPIPIPRLENRFLPNRSANEKVQGYTDQLDPRNGQLDELTTALSGLDAIWTERGDSRPRLKVLDDEVGPFRAIVKCQKEDGTRICLDLEVPELRPGKLTAAPVVAHIRYTESGQPRELWSAVDSCEGSEETAPRASAAAAAGTGSGQAPANPCESTAAGTRIILTRSIPTRDNKPVAEAVEVSLASQATLSRPALTFVQMSDTQLRDPDIKLTDPVLSARLDRLVESFEHDEDQELYGPELAQALIATINEEARTYEGTRGMAPSFVIHTGDAVDSGTRRELMLFHEIMDRLTIPWFNVIGNHDVLVFGNFLPARDTEDKRCVSQTSILAPYLKAPRWLLPGRICVPRAIEGHVSYADTFIAGRSHAEARATFTAEHARHARAKVVQDKSMSACSEVLIPGPNDGQHGFDLYPRKDRNTPLPGYYAFAVRVDLRVDDAPDDRRAIFIALNTEDLEPDEGGNGGRLGTAQVEWLKKALGCVAEHDLVFLFAHHQLGQVRLPDGTGLRDSELLAKHPRSRNIVGYFYGHNHLHGLCRERGSCTRFWELESGSLIEYPQEARLVRIKTIGAGLGFIETVVFTERLKDSTSPFAQRVDLARRGAAHDYCLLHRCSADDRVRREDAEFTNARLFFKLP